MSDLILMGGADVLTNNGKHAGKLRDVIDQDVRRVLSLSVDTWGIGNGRIVPIAEVASGDSRFVLCARERTTTPCQ
jgi:sporulation protein YlmC with PRC-barrel domain